METNFLASISTGGKEETSARGREVFFLFSISPFLSLLFFFSSGAGLKKKEGDRERPFSSSSSSSFVPPKGATEEGGCLGGDGAVAAGEGNGEDGQDGNIPGESFGLMSLTNCSAKQDLLLLLLAACEQGGATKFRLSLLVGEGGEWMERERERERMRWWIESGGRKEEMRRNLARWREEEKRRGRRVHSAHLAALLVGPPLPPHFPSPFWAAEGDCDDVVVFPPPSF